MIVLDTNVVSELMRPWPAPAVTNWLRQCNRRELLITAITVAEILYGIEKLPLGERRADLQSTAHDVFGRFSEDVPAFDVGAATIYAEIAGRRDRAGIPISAFDAQIAAISRKQGAALATRNVRDFVDVGVELIDPWSAGSDASGGR